MGKKRYIVIDQGGPGDAFWGCFKSLKKAKRQLLKNNMAVGEAGMMESDYRFIIEAETGEHLHRNDGNAWYLKRLKDGSREWRRTTQKHFWGKG